MDAPDERDRHVELGTDEWTSDREKPREHFWGSNAVPGLLYGLGFALMIWFLQAALR